MAETLRPWSLVDVADLKNDLGITTETNFDNIIARIANGVTDYIEPYCNRYFKARSITEQLDGTATKDIFLRSPILYVTSMTDKTTVVASANYVVYKSTGRVRLTSGHVWTPEDQAIKAIYRYGYEDAALPQNIKLAAMTWANYWFHAIKDDRMGLQSKSEGDLSISFRLEAIPLEVLELIKPLKAMGRTR